MVGGRQQLLDELDDHPRAGDAFSYSPPYIFFSQYEVIPSATITSLGIALAAMAGVAIVLIPNAISVGLVLLVVVSIDVGVVGIMTATGVALSSVSMINLVLAIGFSVDAAAHEANAFMMAPGFASDTTDGNNACVGGPTRKLRA